LGFWFFFFFFFPFPHHKEKEKRKCWCPRAAFDVVLRLRGMSHSYMRMGLDAVLGNLLRLPLFCFLYPHQTKRGSQLRTFSRPPESESVGRAWISFVLNRLFQIARSNINKSKLIISYHGDSFNFLTFQSNNIYRVNSIASGVSIIYTPVDFSTRKNIIR
jgi:hypothetical protein